MKIEAKELYEWMLTKPYTDRYTDTFQFIRYRYGDDPEYWGYEIDNVDYMIVENTKIIFAIDLYYNAIKTLNVTSYDSIEIDISNISTEILDEELFQLSTLYDTSMFCTEDLKYLIRTCRLLSN